MSKIAKVTVEFTDGTDATMDFEPTTSDGFNQSGTSYSGSTPEGFETVEQAISDAVTKAGLWPQGKDYIVKYLATIMVRVENVDDEGQAESIADDLLREQKISQLLEDAIDPTDFYINVIEEPEAEQD